MRKAGVLRYKREIKFRAWNGKKMQYANLEELSRCISYITDGYDYRRVNLFGRLEEEHSVIMQYTGVRDANGREGYGEDLVRDNIGLIYQIVQSKYHGWVLKGKTSQGLDVKYPLSLLEAWEIVGNIYENPELVEDQDERD